MAGGMHSRGHAWQGDMHSRGHVWWGACMAGGMCGGACMAGGVHGMGHLWHGHTPPILRDTVNERVVRILLECILVPKMFTISGDYFSDTLFHTKIVLI